jgi:hypothetical protein
MSMQRASNGRAELSATRCLLGLSGLPADQLGEAFVLQWTAEHAS